MSSEPQGSSERCTLGSFLYKKKDVLFGIGDSGPWQITVCPLNRLRRIRVGTQIHYSKLVLSGLTQPNLSMCSTFKMSLAAGGEDNTVGKLSAWLPLLRGRTIVAT